MMRVLRTTLTGWKRYRNHADQRIRQALGLGNQGDGNHLFRGLGCRETLLPGKSRPACQYLRRFLAEVQREFGWTSRLFAAVGGPYVLRKIRQEERRWHADGRTNRPRFTMSTRRWRPPIAARRRYVAT